MTLPVSPNPVSMSQVDAELLYANKTQINMGNTSLRQLAGTINGSVSVSKLQGKTWVTTINTSVQGGQIDIRAQALTNNWNTYGPVVCNITANSWSVSSGTPTILISGNFPNGLQLNIATGIAVSGAGGAGGAAGYSTAGGSAGTAGGPAISIVSYTGGPVVFNNNGIIAGGGGGGGGGSGGYTPAAGKTAASSYYGGGGGGGPAFGAAGSSSYSAGAAASFNSPGGGGSGQGGSNAAGAGGTGGTWGTAGSSGGGAYGGGAGGAAGAATLGTIGLVTWIAAGTRYGTVS